MCSAPNCSLSGFTGFGLAWVLLAAGSRSSSEGFCPKLGRCNTRFEALSYPLAMKQRYLTAQESLRAASLGLSWSRGKQTQCEANKGEGFCGDGVWRGSVYSTKKVRV